MHENILIHSADSFTRIYDSFEGENTCLQEFSNFLPSNEDDSRTLINSGTRVCPRYNRVLMTFSYPRSQQPRSILVTPYFTDRTIDLQESTMKQACWVEPASRAGKTLDPHSDEYHMFRNHPAMLTDIELERQS